MGEDHGLDQADATGDGRGSQCADRGDYGCDEEERAELTFGKVEFAREEIGDPGRRDEATCSGVDGEEEAEFDECGARFGRDGGEGGEH